MPALTKTRLQDILRQRLKLKEPRFALEKFGTRLVGSVISKTFRGKGDLRRQQMIWDALEAELGAEANRRVGTLLAYTPQEWDIDLDFSSNGRRAKAG